MNTITLPGWIIFVAVCVVLFGALFLIAKKKKMKILPLIVSAVICAGISVGVFFAVKAIFPEPKNEPVIEEIVEEAAPAEEAAGETTEG
ncbi:MAG: hypothetical protein J6X34_06960 [Clostridia bacterium]|nr:hypothetical protein [Clostridia bacterium]